MELIYLWVEKFKNIDKQGFNFSPRFTCSYNNEKNELSIDESDDYIPDFFGDSINITAIVGRNGSGKSSLLKILENSIEFKNEPSFLIFKKEEKYYCQYNIIQPKITFNKEVNLIDKNDIPNIESSFYPNIIRIAHSEKVGKAGLSHYYFGKYSGIYDSLHRDRQNFYNMLEARFFVPRYINITIDNFELFNRLKQMYKFDTLRLLLKDNSTAYLRRWINNEIVDFRDRNKITGDLGYRKVCIYEENEQILKSIQQTAEVPISGVEIHFYDKNREKIVSILEDIEKIHRSQSFENQINKFNKYYEFDLGVLIAFIEYYLKNTFPCESCELIYQELLILKEKIKNDVVIHDYFFRIGKSHIIGFFEKLKNEKFKFTKDNFLTINRIIEAIKYFQKFEVHYFDSEGNPYIDIPIDEYLKENINHIKIMQKIFFEYDFDCGEEKFLRVFEYDLINNQVGSSYESISDGEKHFIRFAIDIIYHLRALKEYNFTPNKEGLAIFLADEPDNAMHPVWKKRLLENTLEIFNNYSEIPNINIHFVFTTHSPFLLSDIPKQNIIFLDTFNDGKCKVLNNDEVMNKKETFGANIHTLLSDGFFMKDGLMGEFAKKKIQSVIDFLNDDTKTYLDRQKAWSVIQLIGEPFLKHKLEEKYHERFSTDDEKRAGRIKKLEEEIERLRNVKSTD